MFRPITPLLILLMISACSKGRSSRLRPADIAGVSGLETEEFVALKEYVASETNTPSIPKDGDSATFKVTYKKEQIEEFTVVDGDDELRCRYSFMTANLIQTISIETIANEDEGEDDLVVISRASEQTPLEPKYSPILDIAAEKEICDNNKDLLTKTGKAVVVDLGKNFKDFKSFLSRQIINVINSCTKGLRVNGDNCISANVDLLRSPSPLTYRFDVTFGWMNSAGSRYNTELALQFSPELIHFYPVGIFNYSGQLVQPVTEIDLPFTEISLLDLP